MTQAWQLAQMNIGTLVGPRDEPRVQPFFDALDEINALAEVPAGTRPTVNEGLAKLWHLDRFGPTPQAFTFKQRFPAPGSAIGGELDPDGICVGWE